MGNSLRMDNIQQSSSSFLGSALRNNISVISATDVPETEVHHRFRGRANSVDGMAFGTAASPSRVDSGDIPQTGTFQGFMASTIAAASGLSPTTTRTTLNNFNEASNSASSLFRTVEEAVPSITQSVFNIAESVQITSGGIDQLTGQLTTIVNNFQSILDKIPGVGYIAGKLYDFCIWLVDLIRVWMSTKWDWLPTLLARLVSLCGIPQLMIGEFISWVANKLYPSQTQEPGGVAYNVGGQNVTLCVAQAPASISSVMLGVVGVLLTGTIPDEKKIRAVSERVRLFNAMVPAMENTQSLLIEMIRSLPEVVQQWIALLVPTQWWMDKIANPNGNFRKFIEDLYRIYTNEFKQILRYDAASQQQVEELRKYALNISVEAQQAGVYMPGINTILQDAWKKLDELWRIVDNSRGTSGRRDEPFCVYLFGAPGRGKSYLQKEIPLILNCAADRRNLTYSRNCACDHWDAYTGQFCVIYDDFGATRADATTTDPYKELMFEKSDAPYIVPQADISDKGRHFTSRLILCSSNIPYPAPNTLNDRHALWRRRDVLVKIDVDEQYLTVENRVGANRVVDWRRVPRDNSHYIFQLYDPMQQNVLIGAPMRYLEFMRYLKEKYAEWELKLLRNAEDFQQLIEGNIVFPELLQPTQYQLDEQARLQEIRRGYNGNQADAPVNIQFNVAEERVNIEPQVVRAQGPIDVSMIKSLAAFGALNASATATVLTGAAFMTIKGAIEEMHSSFLLEHPRLATAVKLLPFIGMGAAIVGLIFFGRRLSKAFKTELSSNEGAVERSHHVVKVEPEGAYTGRARMSKTARRVAAAKAARQLKLRMRPEGAVYEQEYLAKLRETLKEPHAMDLANAFLVALPELHPFKEILENVIKDHERMKPQSPSLVTHIISELPELIELEGELQAIVDEERKRVSIIAPSSFTAQGNGDPNAFSLMQNLVMRSSVHVNIGGQHMGGLFVAGKVMLTPKHLFVRGDGSYFPDGTQFEVEHDNIAYMTIFEKSSLREIGDDAVLYKMGPQMRSFRDIRRHFARRQQYKRAFTTPAYLTSKTLGGLITYGFVEARYDPSGRGIAYAIRGNNHPDPNGALSDFFAEDGIKLVGGDKIIRYRLPTASGMCGSILIAENTAFKDKILGMHVAGDDRCEGVSYVITAEMLESEADFFEDQVISGQLGNLLDPLISGDFQPQGAFTKHGKLPINMRIRGPIKSKLKPSILHNKIWQTTVGPSVLSPSDSRLKTPRSPLRQGVEKYGQLSPNLEPALLDDIIDHISAQLEVLPKPVGTDVWTEFEAINGLEFNHADGLEMDTSPGLPYNWHKPPGAEPGKKWLFKWDDEQEGYVVNNSDLRTRLDLREVGFQTNRRISSLWVDTLKDEKRTLAKIENGNTRVFTIAPVDYTIAVRRYFGAFTTFFYENRLRFFSAVGINPESQEWTTLALKLTSKGQGGFALDFKRWDGSLAPQVIWAVLEIIQRWYTGNGPEHKVNTQARRILFDEIIHTMQVAIDCVYETHVGNPSGNPLTTPLNTMAHAIYLRYAYLRVAPEIVRSLVYYDDHVVDVVYGDDGIVGTSEIVRQFYNYESVHNELKLVGLESQPPSKLDGCILSGDNVLDYTFLKRGFRVVQPTVVYPIMEFKTICELVNWIHESPDEEAQMYSNLTDAARFLYFYGKTEYNGFFKKVQKHLPGVVSKIPSYDYWDRLFQTERYLPNVYEVLEQSDFIEHVPMRAQSQLKPITDARVGVILGEQRTPQHTDSTTLGNKDTSRDSESQRHLVDHTWSLPDTTSRWSLMATGTWTTSDTVNAMKGQYKVPQQSLVSYIQSMAFERFTFWRGGVTFRLQVNGTNFHQGLLIMYFVPLTAKEVINQWHAVSQTTQTSVAHITVDATSNSSGELMIPFRHLKGYLSMNTESIPDFDYLGYLQIQVFSELACNTGASPSIGWSLFVSFDDTEFKVPLHSAAATRIGALGAYNMHIDRAFLADFHDIVFGVNARFVEPNRQDQGESSYDPAVAQGCVLRKLRFPGKVIEGEAAINGVPAAEFDYYPIKRTVRVCELRTEFYVEPDNESPPNYFYCSEPMRAQGNTITTNATYYGDINDSALPTNVTGDSIGNGNDVSALPMDAPANTLNGVPTYRVGQQTYANVVGATTIQRMALDPSSQNLSTPAHFGTDIDEMDLAYLLRRKTFAYSLDWSVTQVEGARLMYDKIGPMAQERMLALDQTTPTLLQLPLVDACSAPFSFWTGSWDISVRIIANRFYTGRLVFGVHYGTETPPVTMTEIMSQYAHVIDLENEIKCWDFNIPYNCPLPWLRVAAGQFSTDYGNILEANILSSFLGTWTLTVLNPLVSNESTAPNVKILVWVGGGPDYTVQGLYGNNKTLLPCSVYPTFTVDRTRENVSSDFRNVVQEKARKQKRKPVPVVEEEPSTEESDFEPVRAQGDVDGEINAAPITGGVNEVSNLSSTELVVAPRPTRVGRAIEPHFKENNMHIGLLIKRWAPFFTENPSFSSARSAASAFTLYNQSDINAVNRTYRLSHTVSWLNWPVTDLRVTAAGNPHIMMSLNDDMLNYWARFFRVWRGSFRYRVLWDKQMLVPLDYDPDDPTKIVSRAYRDTPPIAAAYYTGQNIARLEDGYLNDSNVQTFIDDAFPAYYTYSTGSQSPNSFPSTRNHGVPLVISHSQAPYMEFEIPFTTQFRTLFTSTTGYPNDEIFAAHTTGGVILSWKSSIPAPKQNMTELPQFESFDITVYRAAGDDFRFGVFLGTPLFQLVGFTPSAGNVFAAGLDGYTVYPPTRRTKSSTVRETNWAHKKTNAQPITMKITVPKSRVVNQASFPDYKPVRAQMQCDREQFDPMIAQGGSDPYETFRTLLVGSMADLEGGKNPLSVLNELRQRCPGFSWSTTIVDQVSENPSWWVMGVEGKFYHFKFVQCAGATQKKDAQTAAVAKWIKAVFELFQKFREATEDELEKAVKQGGLRFIQDEAMLVSNEIPANIREASLTLETAPLQKSRKEKGQAHEREANFAALRDHELKRMLHQPMGVFFDEEKAIDVGNHYSVMNSLRFDDIGAGKTKADVGHFLQRFFPSGDFYYTEIVASVGAGDTDVYYVRGLVVYDFYVRKNVPGSSLMKSGNYYAKFESCHRDIVMAELQVRRELMECLQNNIVHLNERPQKL